ncbi:MAG: amidohydrolase [Candidatus Cloacimonetes bacterium]|nr:amidohydrolase [Candidatus Cloacimonadota bacterium]
MKLYLNARFYSMREEGECFKAILVDDNGVIQETFKTAPKLPNVERIDLDHCFVYPGFIDTHTHSFEGGLYSLSVDLENADTLQNLFDLLAEAKPVSGKVFAFHFDENNIKEKRFPTKQELDKIFPDIPLILRRVDGHSCVINSKAAEMIDLKSLPDFNGLLTGRDNGKVSNWFHRNLTNETILNAYQQAAKIALKTGHTAIHTMIGDAYSNLKHYKLIKENMHHFPIEFILYPQITDVDIALDIGSPRIGGCILADGSFGSFTAALLNPYSDKPDSSGILYRSDEFWLNFITRAHQKNLQVAVHCIGDAAITQILNCYEKVQQNDPKDLKHIIVHNELTSDEMLNRVSKANISTAMQPMFDRLWAGTNGLYVKRLGPERTSRTNRLASIYNRNILLTGGSDWYITEIDALKGIDAATRMHNETERLTPYQAIEIYTKNAAILSCDENRFGTIEKGKLANLTCLKEDILESHSIKDIQIDSVIVDGKYYFS